VRAGRPRVAYAGAFDERFDAEAVSAVAAALPDVELHLVGDGPRLGDVLDAPNVVRHGWMAHDALLELLRTASVGLLPLTSASANQGRSPIKVFEYLAAGCTVVATTTTELERLALGRVLLASSTDELVAHCRAAVEADPPSPAELAQVRASLSWPGRAAQLLEVATAGDRSAA
jgi:teichuronic acid biosynthesis glycosyltransferase TuaH